MLLVVVGASGSAATQSGRSRYRPPHPTTTTTTAPPTTRLKPRLAGIVWPGSVPPNLQSVVNAVYLNVLWKDIEPSPGVFNFASIDAAVARARANRWQILLRVKAGIDAPAWAQNIAGPPVAVSDPQGGGSGLVGRFWLGPYLDAFATLNNTLGARYDSEPTIRKVAVGECAVVFSECFHLGGPAGAVAFHNAGLTEALQKAAILAAVSNTAAAWPTTEVHLALVNEQSPDAGGASDPAYTVDVAAAARALVPRLVIGWNGVRDPLLPLPIWQQYIADHRPADGQSATAARVGNAFLAIDEAAKILHYGSIENSGGAFDQLTTAQLTVLQAELVANA